MRKNIAVSLPVPTFEKLKREAERQGFAGSPKPISRLVAELIESGLSCANLRGRPAVKKGK